MPPPTHINPINNSALPQIPLDANRKAPQQKLEMPDLPPLSIPEGSLFDGITPADTIPRPLPNPSKSRTPC